MNMNLELLITRMDNSSVKELIQLLSTEDINITKAPETGLLMMAAKDSFNTNFYLGEILVTEAEVEYKGLRGHAMVMGDEPERALSAASVDAIFLQTDDSDLKHKVMDFITIQGKKAAEACEMEKRLTAKTRVSFETMVKG